MTAVAILVLAVTGVTGCVGQGGYRATTQLLVLSGSNPNENEAIVNRLRSAIGSAKFANEVAAASGVRASRFKLHACVPKSAAIINVSVDSPKRADADAVASRVAHVASNEVTPPSESLPGPIVQAVYDRPIIEIDPSGEPTC